MVSMARKEAILAHLAFQIFILYILNCSEGAYSTKRDAGKINFRAVDVVAKVAAHEACGSVPAGSVKVDARRYGEIGIGAATIGTP